MVSEYLHEKAANHSLLYKFSTIHKMLNRKMDTSTKTNYFLYSILETAIRKKYA